MKPQSYLLDIGFKMHIRRWRPRTTDREKPRFLLIHGLASNARTWDQVAERLAAAGHESVAVDQRGHGVSEKPATGYDFATITGDLRALLDELNWQAPILVGQSWGGNVVLAFGARFPGRVRQLVFVDGGFLDLRRRGSWETVEAELRPPDLTGIPRAELAARIRVHNPGWSDTAVEATLHNFQTLADGTIRPRLALDRHLLILRALYEQDPGILYPRVKAPVLICVAGGGELDARKRAAVEKAKAALGQAEVIWFPGAAHDIHVDRPVELATRLLRFARQHELRRRHPNR